MLKKIFIFASALFLLLSFGNTAFSQSPNNGAIGIRVFDNAGNREIEQWYADQGLTGKPQSTTIKGYAAVRDGKSWYINGISYDDQDNTFQTRVYAFTISDLKSDDLQKLYDKIVAAIQLTDYRDENGSPIFSADQVEKIQRDHKRVLTLSRIVSGLEKYKTTNKNYPLLTAGTYIQGMTASTWPSWTPFLSLLGVSGQDPLNTYSYGCDKIGFDKVTCWNPQTKQYVNPTGSHIFHYVNVYRDANGNVVSNGGVPDFVLFSEFEYTEKSWKNLSTKIEIKTSVGELNQGGFPYSAVLTQARCGNNVVEEGEECEGNTLSFRSCTKNGYEGQETLYCNSCKYEAGGTCTTSFRCGDGIVNSSAGEQCDNALDNDVICSAEYGVGCSYCNASCRLVSIEGASCGDGVLQNQELCDGKLGPIPDKGVCTSDCQSFSCIQGFHIETMSISNGAINDYESPICVPNVKACTVSEETNIHVNQSTGKHEWDLNANPQEWKMCEYTGKASDCVAEYTDCDKNVFNGCEVKVDNDVNNCGACGLVCNIKYRSTNDGSQYCQAGTCKVSVCQDPSFVISSDGTSCICSNNTHLEDGKCVPNTETKSGADIQASIQRTWQGTWETGSWGAWELMSCNPGWANCNSSIQGDGCETDLVNSSTNCGACGNVCNLPNTSQHICINSTCRVNHNGNPPFGSPACVSNFYDLDDNGYTGLTPNNGCEVDVLNDKNNCGSVGNVCQINYGTAKCVVGICQVESCNTNDGFVPSGDTCICAAGKHLENSVCVSNTRSCTAANTVANSSSQTWVGAWDSGSWSTCTGGQCAANWADLTSDLGCETNLLTDAQNCGSVGNNCDQGNGTYVCDTGKCRVTACNNYNNINGYHVRDLKVLEDANGKPICELNNRACAFAPSTHISAANQVFTGAMSGLAGAWQPCVITACEIGYANNDGNYDCETQLSNVLTCGSAQSSGASSVVVTNCNTGFAVANATPTCTGSGYNYSCGFSCTAPNSGNNAGYHQEGNACVANIQACSYPPSNLAANQTGGTKYWGGGGYNMCNMAVCTTGYASCDGNSYNGCEKNISSNVNSCGSCSNVCTVPTNGVAICSAGTCDFTCNSGYIKSGNTCVLSGVAVTINVKDTNTNSALSGVTITAKDQAGNILNSGNTGANGQLVLTIPTGNNQKLELIKSGYTNPSPYIFNLTQASTFDFALGKGAAGQYKAVLSWVNSADAANPGTPYSGDFDLMLKHGSTTTAGTTQFYFASGCVGSCDNDPTTAAPKASTNSLALDVDSATYGPEALTISAFQSNYYFFTAKNNVGAGADVDLKMDLYDASGKLVKTAIGNCLGTYWTPFYIDRSSGTPIIKDSAMQCQYAFAPENYIVSGCNIGTDTVFNGAQWVTGNTDCGGNTYTLYTCNEGDYSQTTQTTSACSGGSGGSGGGGGGGSCGCFLAKTMIRMADGSEKEIQNIQAGDMILAYDEEKKEFVNARVKIPTKPYSVKDYYIVNMNIKVTGNHPFYVDGVWKQTSELQIGDRLIDEKGNIVLVSSLGQMSSDVQVYNFEVELYHNYFANGILVHNVVKAYDPSCGASGN